MRAQCAHIFYSWDAQRWRRGTELRDLSVESFAQWLPRTRSFTAVPLPYKNVPPRAALLNICPKGANVSHTQSAYFTAAKRRFHTAAKLAAYHFGSQNNYSQRFAAVFHCGGTAAYSPSIISFRVARFLSKSKSSTAMPRTFAFSHVPSTGMCAGSISHSRIIGSSFTA